jgi:hypothetical protein
VAPQGLRNQEIKQGRAAGYGREQLGIHLPVEAAKGARLHQIPLVRVGVEGAASFAQMSPWAFRALGDIGYDTAGHLLEELMIKVSSLQRGQIGEPPNPALGHGKPEGAAGVNITFGINGEVVIAGRAGGAHAAVVTCPDDEIAGHGRKVFFPKGALLRQKIEYPRKEVIILLCLDGYILVSAPPHTINGIKPHGLHTQASQMLRYLDSALPILPADHPDDHVVYPPLLEEAQGTSCGTIRPLSPG